MSDTLIEDYINIKNKIKFYEEKLEIIKMELDNYFEKYNTNVLENRKYKITKSQMCRSFITKNSVPLEIWKQYARPCKTFNQYRIKINK